MSEDLGITAEHEFVIDPPGQPERAHGVTKWRRRGMVLEGLVSREENGDVIDEWIPALTFEPGRLPPETGSES